LIEFPKSLLIFRFRQRRFRKDFLVPRHFSASSVKTSAMILNNLFGVVKGDDVAKKHQLRVFVFRLISFQRFFKPTGARKAEKSDCAADESGQIGRAVDFLSAK
jgi:hypothetical protein